MNGNTKVKVTCDLSPTDLLRKLNTFPLGLGLGLVDV